MPKPVLHSDADEMAVELSVLLDQEFDDEARLHEPQGILFLLTDDPRHYNVY